jgi:hypothetical protein
MPISDFTGTQHSGWGAPGHQAPTGSYLQFDTGRYFDPVLVDSSNTADVTGKGYGAVLVISASNLSVTASNGLILTGLATGQIYDIALRGADVLFEATGKAYLFKRQQ